MTERKKFAIEWEFTIEAVVEAESLEAAQAAAEQHTTGPLQEWADLNDPDGWSTSVFRTNAATDMGVIKNDAGEWEAVHIVDARRRWVSETIKGYAKVRCPECGQEGSGDDFFVLVNDHGPGRLECPRCHTYCIGEVPGDFIVDPGPAEPLPGDQPLPFGEEERV